jgi:hypothetical protein
MSIRSYRVRTARARGGNVFASMGAPLVFNATPSSSSPNAYTLKGMDGDEGSSSKTGWILLAVGGVVLVIWLAYKWNKFLLNMFQQSTATLSDKNASTGSKLLAGAAGLAIIYVFVSRFLPRDTPPETKVSADPVVTPQLPNQTPP